MKLAQLFDNNCINIVLVYNLAFCHQNLWDIKNTLTFITIAIVELETLLTSQKPTNPDFMLYLRASKLLANIYLQTTALYSQLKEHDNALKLAEQGFSQICKTISLFQTLFPEGDQPKRKTFEALFRFVSELQLEAENDKSLAEKVKKSNFRALNWAHNAENVKKFINSQKLDGASCKFSAEWLSSQSISDLMLLKLLKVQDFEQAEEPSSLEEFAVECVNLLAIACFSISTEKRIIAQNEVGQSYEGAPAADAPHTPSKFADLRTQSQLHRNKTFNQSEFFYLKSIEILSKFLDDSLILTSLISKFKSNYGSSVNHITEEDEVSYTVSRIQVSDQKPRIDVSRLSEESIKAKATGPTDRGSNPKDFLDQFQAEKAGEPLFLKHSIDADHVKFKKKRKPSNLCDANHAQLESENHNFKMESPELPHAFHSKPKLFCKFKLFSGAFNKQHFLDRPNLKSELVAHFQRTKKHTSSQKTNHTSQNNKKWLLDDPLASDRAQTARCLKASIDKENRPADPNKKKSQSILRQGVEERGPAKAQSIQTGRKSKKALESIFGKGLHSQKTPVFGLVKHDRCGCCNRTHVQAPPAATHLTLLPHNCGSSKSQSRLRNETVFHVPHKVALAAPLSQRKALDTSRGRVGKSRPNSPPLEKHNNLSARKDRTPSDVYLTVFRGTKARNTKNYMSLNQEVSWGFSK